MLFFIGLGLYDEKDISIKGLEAIRSADLVYAEFYTSRLMGTSLEKLESLYGKKVHVLSRLEVEVDPHWLKDAQDLNVAFLVGGDPMVSTTHLDLRLRALEMGILTRVIHSSSIVTAVSGITGLQNYRFGRSTTIPFPYISRGKRIIPETPYIVLKENLERNLHTMLFLDIQNTNMQNVDLQNADTQKAGIQKVDSQKVNARNADAQNERYMTVNEGAQLLIEMGERAGEHFLSNRLGVGLARAGSMDATVRADLLFRLKEYDFRGPLHILIVPANLHFMEAKALVSLAGAPPDILQGVK